MALSPITLRDEHVVFPTYLPSAPDRNPMFLEKRVYQGSSGRVDPLSFHDPETSFFTMRAEVPHGECVAKASDRPPSFYVTEPGNTTLVRPDWRGYSLLLNL